MKEQQAIILAKKLINKINIESRTEFQVLNCLKINSTIEVFVKSPEATFSMPIHQIQVMANLNKC